MPDEVFYFYVSVRSGDDYRLLIGPFEQEYECLKWVDVARRKVNQEYANDPQLPWYGFGTCKLTWRPGLGLPQGIYNHLLEAGLPRVAPARLPNRAVAIGDMRRLPWDPTRPVDGELNPIIARTWQVVGRPLDKRDCVYVEPVGCDGFKIDRPRCLHLRYWLRYDQKGNKVEL